jgi:hypothetical protein
MSNSATIVTRDTLIQVLEALQTANRQLSDLQLVLAECQQQLEQSTATQCNLNAVIDPFRVALCSKRQDPQ